MHQPSMRTKSRALATMAVVKVVVVVEEEEVGALQGEVSSATSPSRSQTHQLQ